MGIIYEPKGRALEYSPLACNLYTGCFHHCGYCYAPGVMRKKWKNGFFTDVQPRENIIQRLEKDCCKMKGDPREVLLCFGCDPYPKGIDLTTREALVQFEVWDMRVQILTKAGTRACRDFDLLEINDWSFGTSLTILDEKLQKQWEPHAASSADRIAAIERARARGIKTWVSVEAVVDMDNALRVLRLSSRGFIDHWKVGKINYHKYIEDKIDWKAFLEQAEEILEGQDHYIKRDLWEAAGREWKQAKEA